MSMGVFPLTAGHPATPPPPPPDDPHPDEETPTFTPISIHSSQDTESFEKRVGNQTASPYTTGATKNDAGLRAMFSDADDSDGVELNHESRDPWGGSRSAAKGWATGNVFECRNCCFKYDTDKHCPLVLPCGNTFCFTCVKNAIRRPKNYAHLYVLCPSMSCQKKHELTHSGTAEDVPKNNQLLDLLTLHSPIPTPSVRRETRKPTEENENLTVKARSAAGKEECRETRPSKPKAETRFSMCKREKHENHPEKYFCFIHNEYTCSECSFDKHAACWKKMVDKHNGVVDVDKFTETAKGNMAQWQEDLGKMEAVVREKVDAVSARIDADLNNTLAQLDRGLKERKTKLDKQKNDVYNRVQLQHDRLFDNARSLLKEANKQLADALDERLDNLAMLQKQMQAMKTNSGLDRVEAYLAAAEAVGKLDKPSTSYESILASIRLPNLGKDEFTEIAKAGKESAGDKRSQRKREDETSTNESAGGAKRQRRELSQR